MNSQEEQPWLLRAVFIGIAYLSISLVTSYLDQRFVSGPHRVWRLGAGVLSLAFMAAHFGYEHIRLGTSSRSTALHVSAAVGLGSFGIAAAAMLHALMEGTGNLTRHGIALVVFPLVTAIPTFLLALSATFLLTRQRNRPPERPDVV